MNNLKPMSVRIRDTNKMLFEGEVDRITSFNEVGQFDIYPMHANFISILKKGLTLYKNREKILDIKFEQAILKIKNDKAGIYIGVEELVIE